MKTALLIIKPALFYLVAGVLETFYGQRTDERTAGKELQRVPLTVWKEKKEGGGGGIIPLFPLQNVVSGTFSLESTDSFPFSFPMTVLLYVEPCLWDLEAAVVLPRLDLFDVPQTRWRISAVKYKRRGASGGTGGGGSYPEDFVMFHPRPRPLPPRSPDSVALRMFPRMFLIFQRSLPQNVPPTPLINTLLFSKRRRPPPPPPNPGLAGGVRVPTKEFIY